jgi:ubiquinone/menaquinone biosynthesis C-methylase UbiE
MYQLYNVKNCYDLTAEEYAKSFYHELDHKPFDRLILQRFAAENGGRFADLGCGCGHTTKFLAELGVKDLVGIDLSPEMVKVAAKLNQDIAFEIGNILNLEKADEEFGAVLALYSIVHFTYQEIEQAFSEIYRVLKSSGQFLFSFHVGQTETTLLEFLNQKVQITFYFLEVDKILQLLETSGFKFIDTIIRYPYKDAEYPSQRAYILVEK